MQTGSSAALRLIGGPVAVPLVASAGRLNVFGEAVGIPDPAGRIGVERQEHRLTLPPGRSLILFTLVATVGSPVRVRATLGGDGRFRGPTTAWSPDGRVKALADALGSLLRDLDVTKLDALWAAQRCTLSAYGLVEVPAGDPVPLELWGSILTRQQHTTDTLTVSAAELVAVHLGESS